jgi:hypothetical protein
MRAAWSVLGLVCVACFADSPPETDATDAGATMSVSSSTTSASESTDAEDSTRGETTLPMTGDTSVSTDDSSSTGPSTCAGDSICVEPPRDWMGPFAVAFASAGDGVPVCAAPYDQDHGVPLHEGLPDLDCGCECNSSGTPADPCVAELRKYQTDTTCEGATSSTGAGALPGQCTVTGGVNSVTYALTSEPPTAPTCEPMPVDPGAIETQWPVDVVLCRLAEAPTTCEAGVCLPPASDPFQALCVLHAGEVACPDAFTEEHLLYVDADDQRTCDSCGCDPTAGDCTPVIYRATDENCDDIDAGETECVDTSAEDIVATTWLATEMPGCYPTQVVSGDVFGVAPHTLCCQR